jgi:predicted permease
VNWHGWKWTIARLFRLTQTDQDLDDEIRAHLAIETRRRVDAGDPVEAAGAASEKDFGNISLIKETTREMWTSSSLERLWQDCRFAFRSLRRSFGFTLLALAALALGIGSTTAMFTVVYTVIVRPLPFPDPARLVTLWERSPRSTSQNVVSLVNFRFWHQHARAFDAMAAYNERPMNLLGADEPVQTTGANVAADFFRVLRINPILGRAFAPGEDGPTARPLALLSYGFWQRRFGGQADVIGRRISIAGSHHEIIGVLPREFAFPSPRADVFANLRAEYSGRDFLVVARLRPGIALSAAQSDMARLAVLTAAERPNMNTGWSATATPLHEQTVGRIQPLLRVFFATVLLVLLIACANVANLVLMRALGRTRELNVRLALGAGRWQIARLLTVESLVLAVAGGLLGTLAATWGLRALLATLPADFPLPRINEIAVDSSVLWFAIGLCVAIGLLFGMVPLFIAGRRDLAQSLRSGGRSVAPRQRRFRHVMVITEMAVALVLVVGAGLLIRSLVRLHQVELGFQSERVLTARMILLPGKLQSQAQVIDEILHRVRALPQVVSASSISIPPMFGSNSGTWYYRADRPEPERANRPGGDISLVMPGYFRTMGIPLLKGRDFTDQDRFGGRHVGIVNATAAQIFFGAEDPIGKTMRVHWNNAGVVEVVGVAADIRHRNPQSKPDPCVFLPNTQLPFPMASLVIRTAGDPHALISAVKSEIRQVDSDQGVAEFRTMEERVADAGAQPRLQAWLVATFSLVALALACIGIYGVISYTVSQRTREIGVRLALGADRLIVFGQILRESLTLAGAGIAVGLLASLALTRYLETLLFEIRPTDPVVYASVPVLMLIVAAAASYFPSRRAAAVDPVVTLRDE